MSLGLGLGQSLDSRRPGQSGNEKFQVPPQPFFFFLAWPSCLQAGCKSGSAQVINSDYGIKQLRVHFCPDSGIASIFIEAEADKAWSGAPCFCSAVPFVLVKAS